MSTKMPSRKQYDLMEKKKIVDLIRSGKETVTTVVVKYGMKQSTVSTWLSPKSKFYVGDDNLENMQRRKRFRKSRLAAQNSDETGLKLDPNNETKIESMDMQNKEETSFRSEEHNNSQDENLKYFQNTAYNYDEEQSIYDENTNESYEFNCKFTLHW